MAWHLLRCAFWTSVAGSCALGGPSRSWGCCGCYVRWGSQASPCRRRRDPNRSSVPGMWELRSANCAMVPSFAEHVLDVALAEADAEGIRLSNSSSDLSPNLTVSSATRNRFQWSVQMQAAAVVQLQLQILLMDKHSTRRLRILIALYESWCYDLFSVPGVLCSFCSSCPPWTVSALQCCPANQRDLQSVWQAGSVAFTCDSIVTIVCFCKTSYIVPVPVYF